MPRGKKTAKEIKADARAKADKAAEVIEEAKAQVEKAVEEVKPAVERTVNATRKGAAKAGEKVKNAVANIVDAEAQPVVYIQYQGAEKSVEELLAAAKDAFAAEQPGVKAADIKLYIKPEERTAYYVINETFAGSVAF